MNTTANTNDTGRGRPGTGTARLGTGRGRVGASLLCLAAGTLVGVLATVTASQQPAGGAPPARQAPVVHPADPARFGSPGHVTMSADAIEQWILHGSPNLADPARFGSPGHVTMSADAIEQWILHS